MEKELAQRFLEYALTILIAGASTLIGAYVSYRVTTAVNNRRWVEMDSINVKHDKYHAEQSERTRNLETALGTAIQKFASHETLDTERFDNLKETHLQMWKTLDEISKDVKTVVREVSTIGRTDSK